MALDEQEAELRGLPPEVGPGERISRFVRSRSQFAPEKQRVKRAAFMPSGEPLQLSVFRTENLTEDEVWNLAQHLATPPRARGDIGASAITAIGLSIDADDHPPRHANILGWSLLKEEQNLKALELERGAHLVMAPLDAQDEARG